MSAGISVVIITLNEENNIANAITSVKPWAREVIVVDMMSDDRTVEIARSLGALVYDTPRIAAFDGARSIGVEHAAGAWILLLDADEVIPAKLAKKLLSLTSTGSADAYQIPRLNYFSGAPLRHTGFGPIADRQLRFYRAGAVRLTDALHSYLEIQPGQRVASLDYEPQVCIVHFNHTSSRQFIEKLNRYTTVTATQRKNTQRYRDRSLVLVPLAIFLNQYVRKCGFRDGWRGFYYSFMMGVYRMTQTVKFKEIASHCDDEGSMNTYREIARQILLEYTE
jgi:glycosyltransferase involved in cell wall biosynthesis